MLSLYLCAWKLVEFPSWPHTPQLQHSLQSHRVERTPRETNRKSLREISFQSCYFDQSLCSSQPCSLLRWRLPCPCHVLEPTNALLCLRGPLLPKRRRDSSHVSLPNWAPTLHQYRSISKIGHNRKFALSPQPGPPAHRCYVTCPLPHLIPIFPGIDTALTTDFAPRAMGLSQRKSPTSSVRTDTVEIEVRSYDFTDITNARETKTLCNLALRWLDACRDPERSKMFQELLGDRQKKFADFYSPIVKSLHDDTDFLHQKFTEMFIAAEDFIASAKGRSPNYRGLYTGSQSITDTNPRTS